MSSIIPSSNAFGSDDINFEDDVLEVESIIWEDHDKAASPQFSSVNLQAIHARPLFAESRRSAGQERGLEISTLIIEGNVTTVELIGTIDSNNEQIAGFTLGGKDTVWLQRKEYLGDWRIDEITPNQVRLNNEDKSQLINLREAASKENEHVEG